MNFKRLELNFEPLEIQFQPPEIHFGSSEMHLEPFWEDSEDRGRCPERAAEPPAGVPPPLPGPGSHSGGGDRNSERGRFLQKAPPMRFAVLVNRAAGTARPGEITQESVEKAFRDAGADAVVEMIPGEEMVERAKAAVRAGFDAVVAGGGDGTVRCVAGVLAGTGKALGVLPLGTLNHFARDLKIPEDL